MLVSKACILSTINFNKNITKSVENWIPNQEKEYFFKSVRDNIILINIIVILTKDHR